MTKIYQNNLPEIFMKNLDMKGPYVSHTNKESNKFIDIYIDIVCL